MNTYDFTVTIAHSDLDTEVVIEVLREAIQESLPEGTLAVTKFDGRKSYSEQGWKVARSRKFGITVKDAGDASKATVSKKELVEV